MAVVYEFRGVCFGYVRLCGPKFSSLLETLKSHLATLATAFAAVVGNVCASGIVMPYCFRFIKATLCSVCRRNRVHYYLNMNKVKSI